MKFNLQYFNRIVNKKIALLFIMNNLLITRKSIKNGAAAIERFVQKLS